MSRLSRRTGSGTLSLVVSTSTAVAPPAHYAAAQTAPMADRWFEEEVGYVSEMPVGLAIATGALEKGQAG